jgi:ATP-dependent Lon protease
MRRKEIKKRNHESDTDTDTEKNVDTMCESLNKKLRHEFDTVASKIENRIKHERCDKEADKKYGSIRNKIEKEIESRNIIMNQIYELTLDMNEYIWFYQYIQIRDNMNDENDEKINLTNSIYQKYTRLKDFDYYGAEKLMDNIVTEKCIVKRIIESDHDDYVKSILFKKYKLFCENRDSYSEEYSKCIEWLDTVLTLPTRSLEMGNVGSNKLVTLQKPTLAVSNKLRALHNFLSTKIYGLDTVKEKIMEAMCCKILNPQDTSGKILTLIGPPGVGKTSVASTIAEAMNLPFEQISFGSIQDSKILTGHSSTYIGAVPGLFTKILIKAKRLDSLVLLDEIDKITNSMDSNITSVLYHVLDKSQNHRFKDIYIPEISLDLSKIIFLCAANDINLIDPILRDRMTIIDLPGYTVLDKVNISEIYLVPKFKKELKFEDNEVIIDNKELEYLISEKTKDQPGMRDVERKLKELFDRLALLKYSKDIVYSFDIKNIKFPIKITSTIIDKLLV